MVFNVRGGPHHGADRPSAPDEFAGAAAQAGALALAHDTVTNVYAFVLDAPTAPEAFTTVAEIFRPVFGEGWWAEIAAFQLEPRVAPS